MVTSLLYEVPEADAKQVVAVSNKATAQYIYAEQWTTLLENVTALHVLAYVMSSE
jgi:hypothetical protein